MSDAPDENAQQSVQNEAESANSGSQVSKTSHWLPTRSLRSRSRWAGWGGNIFMAVAAVSWLALGIGEIEPLIMAFGGIMMWMYQLRLRLRLLEGGNNV